MDPETFAVMVTLELPSPVVLRAARPTACTDDSGPVPDGGRAVVPPLEHAPASTTSTRTEAATRVIAAGDLIFGGFPAERWGKPPAPKPRTPEKSKGAEMVGGSPGCRANSCPPRPSPLHLGRLTLVTMDPPHRASTRCA